MDPQNLTFPAAPLSSPSVPTPPPPLPPAEHMDNQSNEKSMSSSNQPLASSTQASSLSLPPRPASFLSSDNSSMQNKMSGNSIQSSTSAAPAAMLSSSSSQNLATSGVMRTGPIIAKRKALDTDGLDDEDEEERRARQRKEDEKRFAEKKAKNELFSFLQSKGIDPKRYEAIKVICTDTSEKLHGKVTTQKGDSIQGLSNYAVKYRAPDGTLFVTKSDVASSLASKSGSSSVPQKPSAATGHGNAPRKGPIAAPEIVSAVSAAASLVDASSGERSEKAKESKEVSKEKQEFKRKSDEARRQEKEREKETKDAERRAREQEKNDLRKKKEEEKSMKEGEKARQASTQQYAREKAKAIKAAQKEADKYRTQYRGDVKKEVNRHQRDARDAVQERFDAEEGMDSVQLFPRGLAHIAFPDSELVSDLPNAQSLDSFIATLPSPHSSALDAKQWEQALSLSSFATTFQQELDLQSSAPLTLDKLLSDLNVYHSPVNANKSENADIDIATRSLSIASIDRLQLCLTKACLGSLYTLLDLDPDANDDRLPLNELTWPELARMAIVSHIALTLSRPLTKDDALGLVRGGRGIIAGGRLNKNVARMIKYRLKARKEADSADSKIAAAGVGGFVVPVNQCRDDHLLLMMTRLLCNTEVSPSDYSPPYIDVDAEDTRPWADESEMLTALLSLCDSPEHDETTKRCGRILMRLIAMPFSKQLLWQYDRLESGEYFHELKRPIMLSSVAVKLIKRLYQTNQVANEFYHDLRQVVLNGLAYYCDTSDYIAKTIKLLHCITRLTQQWLLLPSRPPLDQCTEEYCLVSRAPIKPQSPTALKCGRCYGMFCTNGMAQLLIPSLVRPTSRHMDHTSQEEWFCPLCVSEDSVTLLNKTGMKYDQGEFYLNEFGPSTLMPWQLNQLHSHVVQQDAEAVPRFHLLLDALKVLAAPLSTLPPSLSSDIPSWSCTQRLTVLSALQALLLNDSPFQERSLIESTKVCDSLLNMATLRSWDSGKSAEFCRRCEEITNSPDGAAIAANLLKSIDGQDTTVKYVAEGTCWECLQLCADSANVFACIDCNSLIHTSCLSGTNPRCPPCHERYLVSGTVYIGKNTVFTDMDKYRSKEQEEALLNLVCDLKAARDVESADVPPHLRAILAERQGMPVQQCEYCRFSEEDMCSPLVVGHIANEHREHISRSRSALAGGFLSTDRGRDVDKWSDGGAFGGSRTGTVVSFFSGDTYLPPPAVTLPYFPFLSSINGDALLAEYKKVESAYRQDGTKMQSGIGVPVIAHQICALQMFQHRIERLECVLRRKRRLIAQHVIDLAGLFSRPLGVDDAGREYWKFPCSRDLYLCESESRVCSVQEAFRVRIREKFDGVDLTGSSAIPSLRSKSWRVIDGTNVTALTALVQTLESRASAHGRSPKSKVSHTSSGLSHNEHALLQELVLVVADATVLGSGSAPAASSAQVTSSVEVVTDETKMDIDQSGSNASEEYAGANETKGDQGAVSVAVIGTDMEASTSNDAAEVAKDAMEVDSSAPAISTATLEVIDLVDSPKKLAVPAKIGGSIASQPPKQAENIAVCLKLFASKGTPVDSYILIDNQPAFTDTKYSDDPEDESALPRLEEYIFFESKKKLYYCVALANSDGKRVKVPKGNGFHYGYEITRTVKHGGVTKPLYVMHDNDPYQDGYAYFQAPRFLRAGKYVIKFLVLGSSLGQIESIEFPITVECAEIVTGPRDALEQLVASEHIDDTKRRPHAYSIKRHYLLQAIDAGSTSTSTEIQAIKSALVSIFLALPIGSLETAQSKGVEYDPSDYTECPGWCDALEIVWMESLLNAGTAMELMECVVLLEHSIARQWLDQETQGPYAALPSFHFAMRGISLSSVALRVFALDRALSYDKIEVESATRSKGRKPSKKATYEDSEEEEEEESDDDDDDGEWNKYSSGGRSKRAAAQTAQSRIKHQAHDLQSGERSYDRASERVSDRSDRDRRGDTDRRGRDSPVVVSGREDTWTCGHCTVTNLMRARSCDGCGEKKTAVMLERGGDRGRSSTKKKGKPTKKRRAQDSDDEDEDDESEDEEEESEEDELPSFYTTSNFNELEFDSLITELAGGEMESNADMTIRLLCCLRALARDDRSREFWRPVDIAGYGDIIPQPMDLNKVSYSIISGVYLTPEACLAHVELVWSNCETFNGHQSPYSKLAKAMRKLFKGCFDKWIGKNQPNLSDVIEE